MSACRRKSFASARYCYVLRFWKSFPCHFFMSSFNDRLNYCNLDVMGGRLSGTQSCDQCASFGINSNCLPDLLPELTKLHGWIIVLKRSSPAQSLSGVFSYFIFFSGVTVFTFVFSPICQNILYRKYCLRCHSDLKQVFVLLRGGESHCIWRRLSLAQLSLLSGFQRKGGGGKMSACDNSSTQAHISSAPYVGILSCSFLHSIMSTLERVDALQKKKIKNVSPLYYHNRECLRASTAEYNTHLSILRCRLEINVNILIFSMSIFYSHRL